MSRVSEMTPEELADVGEVPFVRETTPGSGTYVNRRFNAGGLLRHIPTSVRTIESFGAVKADYNQTPTDNLVAFNAAAAWCAATGGKVILGAGDYGVDGSIDILSYLNFEGLHYAHSRVIQLSSTPADTFTSGAVANESRSYARFSNFTIDGGWSPAWGADRSTHTVAGIRLDGDSGGPDDPVSLGRENTGSQADPYHIVEGMRIVRVPGSGLVLDGRGENHIIGNNIAQCSLYGIDIFCPDSWFSDNSVRVTGDSAVRCQGGNNRFSNEKYWFCGMRTDQEGVGAGLEVVGGGIANLVGSNLTTQDTWGPALALDGDAPKFDGNFDEAGGGRLEEQSFGWAGSRTKERSFIRMDGSAKGARVEGSVRGGSRMGASEYPLLVDIDGSSVYNSEIDLYGIDSLFTASPAVRVSSGNTNARKYNRVSLNKGMLLGTLTETRLEEPLDSINDGESPHDEVVVDDGRKALRFTTDTGDWNYFHPDWVGTQTEYDAITTKDPNTLYHITGP